MENINNGNEDESLSTGGEIMDEKIQTEITNGGNFIGISATEALEKYESICEENGTELNGKTSLALWRSYVAQFKRQKQATKSNGGFSKSAFGYFVSLDAPRDMMSWNRKKAKEAWAKDDHEALTTGVVALADETDDGRWNITRYFQGEKQERMVANLPDGAEEIDGINITLTVI